MKKLLGLFLLMSLSAFAHEGGHGEVEEGGKFGGVAAPVFRKEDEKKVETARPVYKAELVRSEDGTLRVYLHDEKMNPFKNLDGFSEKLQANLEVNKKGKFTYFGKFELTKSGNHYHGKLPAVEYKPFSIDMYFSKDTQQLFVGFSNLD